ncbi:cytochrome P450 [Hysterangium stoloniferum]|nr:cytochrome P450 [Hysterangium stoloniferum]
MLFGLDLRSLLLVGAVLAGGYYIFGRRRIPKGLQLPPGPPGHWLLGNLTDYPRHHDWLTYSKWAKTYGKPSFSASDLVHINIIGKSMMFINSNELVHELFENRSSIYSDRPNLPMFGDLVGFDWTMALMRYGEWWRRHRAVIHQNFNITLVERYQPFQVKRSRDLLRQMKTSPKQFYKHLRHSTAAVTLEIAYGIQVLPENDPYITLITEAVTTSVIAAQPGAFLVDIFPILKYVPEWVPGAGFKRKARIWRTLIMKMVNVPFQAAKDIWEKGSTVPSLAASLFEDLNSRTNVPLDEEEIIRNVTGIVHVGGSDTTLTAMEIFLVAMLKAPEAQAKAQKELDEVLGPDQLPTFQDVDKLPYISALYKEVLRWHPVVPTGFPHCVTQDDVVGNYFIPAGTMLFGNSWEILHSEALYGPETDKFKPERFLQPGVIEPNAAFGYGRRVCPGRRLAENSLFIMIASILHAFRITPTDGYIPPDDSFTQGLTS